MNEFGVKSSFMFTQVTTDRLRRLAELVDSGVVKIEIDKTFPLDPAAAALKYVEKESQRGKVVLKIA